MALDKFLLLSGLSLHIRPQELVYPFGKAQGSLVLTLALWRPRAVEVGGAGATKVVGGQVADDWPGAHTYMKPMCLLRIPPALRLPP